MILRIDGHEIQANPEQSLLELVKLLNLWGTSLSERPLSAKIAGEVFTLNYIPGREGDSGGERPSMRRAMAASGGEVRLLRYRDTAGKDTYIRTAQFVIFLALRQLWPEATAFMDCTLGASVYISVTGANDFSASRLKQQVEKIIRQDIPLIRKKVLTKEAIERFSREGQTDKARLLSWRNEEFCSEYSYGDYSDNFYGEMAPSTGILSVWDILPADGGFLFVYPDDLNPDKVARISPMPQFFSVFSEGERWCRLMKCETAADLNELTVSGKIR